MKLLKIFCILLILSFSLGACEKLLQPEADNHNVAARLYRDPVWAEGLLMRAYSLIPTNNLTYNEVATDDAVNSNKLDTYLRMATGEWTSLYNPVTQWDNNLSAIMYINNFLSIVKIVPYKPTNPEINDMFIRRLSGEAYALRGLFEFFLLQNVGGIGSNGQLLGIPLYNSAIQVDANFNITRAGYSESVTRIYSDLDSALVYLTMDDYKNLTDATQLPPGLTTVNVTNYNTVFGNIWRQRINGRIVKALKARVALLAASPAFNPTNDFTLWQAAANYAGAAIINPVGAIAGPDGIGGIAGIDANGHKWYQATYVNAISVQSGTDQKEMLWRRAKASARGRETNNYPPSLFGLGYVNPTQNLVDAFPMANGYPISNPLSLYNPANPYAARDPRLGLYIVYNGATEAGKIITTAVGGGNNAKDSLPTSTRTGYYLRKLLREDVVVDPNSAVSQNHYEVHMRWTELLLIYAEAQNEALGPDANGTFPFSARNVIAAIRKRAGISQADNYLASITTQADMRTLIRNERRLELCFEGFRFWDLRRWKADLTETAKGVNISKGATTYTVVNVETRKYDNSYMYFAPIPQKEILKYSGLFQNNGW